MAALVSKWHANKPAGTLAHQARCAIMSDIDKTDIYDGEPWSEMDLWDLKNSLAYGDSIEEVAEFLCRSSCARPCSRVCATILQPDHRPSFLCSARRRRPHDGSAREVTSRT